MKFYLASILVIVSTLKVLSNQRFISITDPSFNLYFSKHSIPKAQVKILNASEEDLAKIKVSYSLVSPFKDLQTGRSTKINTTTGVIPISVDYPLPYQQIWLQVSDFYYGGIYLNEGLLIELDFSKLKRKNVDFYGDGVKFKGKDAEFNLIMNKLVCFKREKQLDISSKISGLSEIKENYIQQLDSLFTERKNLENEFLRMNPCQFEEIITNDRLSEYYRKILTGMLINGEIPKEWEQIKRHRVLLISNSSMLFYRDLFQFFQFAFLKSNLRDGITTEQLLKINSVFGLPYADVLKIQIINKCLVEDFSTLITVNSSIRTSWVKSLLKNSELEAKWKTQRLNEALTKASKIKDSSSLGIPLIELPFGAKLIVKENYTKPEDFLLAIINTFKGRAIIIDFWATWCEPCLKEMPFGRALQKETLSLPLEFVYICSSKDSSLEKWKFRIAQMEQPGYHLFVNRDLVRELMSLVGETGFPSYLAINRSGTLMPGFINHFSSTTIADLKKLSME